MLSGPANKNTTVGVVICCLLVVILQRQPQLIITYAFKVELLQCVPEWERNRDITAINGENLTVIPGDATQCNIVD